TNFFCEKAAVALNKINKKKKNTCLFIMIFNRGKCKIIKRK
ncbi:MAG: hypothetical protein ACI9JT_002675, partial [Polaribacter sp.]